MTKCLFLGFALFAATSIYTFKIRSVNGTEIDFGKFRGKKILLVNIATSSPLVKQLQQLERLYQLHKDSLVIIAFPSNSFGKEFKTNAQIDSFCRIGYGTHFLLAEKKDVGQASTHPLFNWLSKKNENGATSAKMKSDFQKFLIDKNGNLKSLFSASVDPMSQEMIKQITSND